MKIDLSSAEQTFAISNTPLFLLHKLRADPVVQQFGRSSVTSEAILKKIESCLQRKPRNLRDAVEPYAYLVALSFRRDSSLLQKAGELPTLYFDWYHYIANALFESFQPTSIFNINVPGTIVAPGLSTNTGSPTTRILLP
jgi:hypothetical protein